MFDKIIAFFMSIISLFMSLSGISSGKIIAFENVSYGLNGNNILDMYIPEGAEGDIGLVLMIHGGSWTAGDKAEFSKHAKMVAANYNCATASINYRFLSEHVTMNDLLDDITAATVKIKEIGEENGINIKKMMLTGASAGGHLSLLYAYSRAEEAIITPVAVTNLCGPSDFTDINFLNSDIGKSRICVLFSWASGTVINEENIEDNPALLGVSPVNYAHTAVPTITAHGKKDLSVPFSNAQTLDEALENAGVRHDFITYEKSGHGLSDDIISKIKTYELFGQYINEYLK